MSIANPNAGIVNFKTIPVNCAICSYYEDLTDISDVTKKALIDISYSHQLNEELKSTIRAEELFNRHPNSKHELVLEYFSEPDSDDVSPEPDEAFEKDLDDNPDIAKFIIGGHFVKGGRLFVRGRDKELQNYIDQLGKSCPLCGSYLVLPDVFLSMVGSYLDNIALERSRLFVKRLKASERENKSIDKNLMYPFSFY